MLYLVFLFYIFLIFFFFFFFFNDPATTEIYTFPYTTLFRSCWCCRPSTSCSRCAPSCRSSSPLDRKSTRLNSSHVSISYAVFCLKKKKKKRLTYYDF